jgi:hypothetical protein
MKLAKTAQKDFLFILLLAAAVSLFVSTSSFAQNTRQLTREDPGTDQKRIALVIGNGDYLKVPKLENPVNDATDMAKTLSEVGFEVIFGTDLTLRDLTEKVREFGDRLRAEKGVGLVYYAGHGVQFGGNNYLVPVDAEIPREDEVKYQTLDLNFVLGKMDTANNGLNIVILDACRNNPFARGWSRSAGDGGGGLAQVNAPTGTFIAYATAPNMTASDGEGRNGLYTAELLKQLRMPGLKIEEAFKRVTDAVARKSGEKQVPWTSSSLRGEFYFAGGEGDDSGSAAGSAESALWKEIENSSDETEISGYLARVNNGELPGAFRAIAEVKLNRIRKARAPEQWARIRSAAKELLKFSYVEPTFSEGYARVMLGEADEFGRGGNYGFIDRSGVVVIPPKFSYVGVFSEGKAPASLDGTAYGYIDKSGEMVIAPKYGFAGSFSQGLAPVRTDGGWGYINSSGDMSIPARFGIAREFSEGLAFVREGETSGYIDLGGRMVTDLGKNFIGGSKSSEGLFLYAEDYKWGYLNKAGKPVIPAQYSMALSFSDGWAAVQSTAWGFIDKTGKEVIPAEYTAVNDFSEGRALVVKGGMPIMSRVDGVTSFYTEPRQVGFIDKAGKKIVPLIYSDARPFDQGFAMVSKEKKWGLLDRNGTVVLPIRYDEIWCTVFATDGIFGVTLDEKKGFVDIYGNEYFDF